MNHEIELLPKEEIKILKVFQIRGPEWHPFIGYFSYLRDFNPPEYNYVEGDILDKSILNTLQSIYPQTKLYLNYQVFFKGHMEYYLKFFRQGILKKIKIQFEPIIPYDQLHSFLGKNLRTHLLSFNLYIVMGYKKDEEKLINDYFLCRIPHDMLDNIIKTIKPFS